MVFGIISMGRCAFGQSVVGQMVSAMVVAVVGRIMGRGGGSVGVGGHVQGQPGGA